MDYEAIAAIDERYYMNIFGKRLPVAFEKGEGMYLTAQDGKKYLDFFGGIAVNAVGYSHPRLTEALRDQVGKLIHTSSLYYIESQALLAEKLVQNSCADRVMFANSGAEANEGAMKLAKIYHYKKGNTQKNEIITLKNSFHGRTLATVAATGQEKYQAPYRPLLPGVMQVEPGDFNALLRAVSDKTAAIMVEPIQGESGVHPLKKEYLQKIRALCDQKDIVFIMDEVQTGIGRTGRLFGYQTVGVEPDVFTLAKALGGGVPIGAVCAKAPFAAGFEPGDHGTTFGGNPLATRAGLCVLQIVFAENLLENARTMGAYIRKEAEAIPGVKSTRGEGLMIGIEVEDAPRVRKKLFQKQILVGSVGSDTLRLLPPLIVKKEEADIFLSALKEVVG